MSDPDVIVIGAGAAGIAAARELRSHGVPALVLEAAGRVGGRAHTVRREGWALDLGCGWLHSGERNPWTAFARSAGLTLDRAPTRWDTQWRDLGFSPADQTAFGVAYAAFQAKVERLAGWQDVPLSAALPDNAWRATIEAVIGYLDGAAAADVSLHDHHAFDTASSDNNWRVQEGLGTTIARAAYGLDVRLGTRADTVALTGGGVRVAGPAGSIDAARVIVTVSTAVLASDAIRFDPPIPGQRAAAAALPLGMVGKLFLAVDRAEDLPINGHLRGRPYHARSASHRLRPFGWPIIECYFGGAYAEVLGRAGEAATADAMIGELTGLFGSGWRRRLRPLAASAWHADPLIGGAWSHALPGGRAARAAIAAPLHDRVFFAGEACATGDVGTAHGAHATGVAAAQAALASLTPSLAAPQ